MLCSWWLACLFLLLQVTGWWLCTWSGVVIKEQQVSFRLKFQVSLTQLFAAYSRPRKLIHHRDNDEATYRLLLLKVKEAIKSLTDNRLCCQRHHRINWRLRNLLTDILHVLHRQFQEKWKNTERMFSGCGKRSKTADVHLPNNSSDTTQFLMGCRNIAELYIFQLTSLMVVPECVWPSLAKERKETLRRVK